MNRRTLRLNTWQIVLLLANSVSLVGYIDYHSGRDISLSLFYALAVMAAGWYAGRAGAAILLIWSLGVHFLTNYNLEPTRAMSAASWLDGLFRAMLWGLIGAAAALQREQLRRLQQRLERCQDSHGRK